MPEIRVACERIESHPHARLRMRQRKIAEDQIGRALAGPDRVTPSHSGRFVAEYDTAAGNTLRVVYEERSGGMVAFVWTVSRIAGKRS